MNELPLQELFTRLREAGLPLGIDEYQSVLRAMQAGFGMADKGALKRLCQTLWVKSAEEKRLFEYHFEQIMFSESIVANSPILARQSRHRKMTQITRYVILGILSVGIILGFRLSSIDRTLVEKQNQKETSNKTTNITPTQKQKQNRTQPDLIFVSILFVVSLLIGYVLGWWVIKQIAKRRDVRSTFPERTQSKAASTLILKLTQVIKVKNKVQVAPPVMQVMSKPEEVSYERLFLTSEYFPVTQRQMKQTWRHLRRLVREGPPTELDVEATVNQIAHQGLLLEPVLVPRRINRAEMLLLIDQEGSMVPFHSLSLQLAETAWRGGHLRRTGVYYFHNCPIDYLYHDPNHQEAELVNYLITHICSQQTAVLIVSDAGAARGGYSNERYELTKKFLTELKQKVRHIAWLNPMPRSRWSGTTAGEITRLVAMFEVNRRGIQDAIDVLRGRPTNFEGRKK